MTAGNVSSSVRGQPGAAEAFAWFDPVSAIPAPRSESAETVSQGGEALPGTEILPDPQVPDLEAAGDVDRVRFWTESRIRTGVLVLLCLLAVVVLQDGHTGGNAPGSGGNWSLVSSSMVQTLTASEGVVGASGGYLPGVGLVFYAELNSMAREALDVWLLGLISPMSARLAELPGNEAVVWHLAVTGDTAYSQLVRIPPDAVTVPSKWSESIGEPLAAPVAGATVPPAATAAPTTAAPTTAAPTTAAPTTAPPTTAKTTPAAGATPTPTAAASTAAGTATTTPTPTASASATVAPAAAGGRILDDFSAGPDKWKTLTGTWEVADGVYHQGDASGYDLITQLSGSVPKTYDVQVKMRATGDKLGAGLMIGQPRSGTRNGATVIDVTDGSYLRWGTYAAGGTYTFVGGNGLSGTAATGEWHTLKVSVQAKKTVISWDTKVIGEITAVAKGGVGLVTSVSAVDFDDFSLTPR